MLNCIAIDDEPRALDIIELYINKTPFLNLEIKFRDSLQALDYFKSKSCDLIFLDINMPDLNGIEFLESLRNPPMAIFTTAYSKYAIQSYDFEAVDYLLKPINFRRFLKASTKAYELYQLKNNQEVGSLPNKKDFNEFIQIKSGSEIHNLRAEDILFVEGAQNYVFIHTKDQRIMSLQRLKEMEKQLDEEIFCRVHKSYIVNVNQVYKIENHQLHIQDQNIPIGKIYKEIFFRKIKK